MSIDARIVGVSMKGYEYKLTLEPRSKSSVAGQQTLQVVTPITDQDHFADLIDCEVWGNASQLMLRNAKLADRISYTQIRLVHWWRELVKAYK